MIESFKLPNITPETLTGSIVSFNDEYGGLPLKSCSSLISGYQEGSGIPSPSNVRPLHAWSSANLTACGTNLWDEEWESGEYDPSGNKRDNPAQIRSKNFCPCKGGVYVYQKAPENGRILFYDKDYTFILRTSGGKNRVVAVPANACYFTMYCAVTEYENNISINYPSLDDDYHPYNGNTYTFTFGQSIYQGYIDWESGVIKGEKIVKTVDENSGVAMSATEGIFYLEDFFYIDNDNDSIDCNWYQKGINRRNTAQVANNEDYSFCCQTQTLPRRLMIKDTRFTTIEDYKTWLTTNPVKIAVKLATPIEIPLSGINLLTQEGVNNIFCDTGDTEVKRLKVN